VFYSNNGDAKLKEIISKIQLMHKQFGGVNDGSFINTSSSSSSSSSAVQAGGGSDRALSLPDLISLLQTLTGKVSSATDEFIIDFKERYGLPKTQDLMQKFEEGMMRLSER
jgi:hypothetical protein